jgi:hypothetical protein
MQASEIGQRPRYKPWLTLSAFPHAFEPLQHQLIRSELASELKAAMH